MEQPAFFCEPWQAPVSFQMVHTLINEHTHTPEVCRTAGLDPALAETEVTGLAARKSLVCGDAAPRAAVGVLHVVREQIAVTSYRAALNNLMVSVALVCSAASCI